MLEFVPCEIDVQRLAKGILGERVALLGRPDQCLVDVLPQETGAHQVYVFVDVPVLAALFWPTDD